jgi:hypothetical protein
MLDSRRTNFSFTSRSSARIVRERLLCDQTMRRHRPHAGSPTPERPLKFPPAGASPRPLEVFELSPVEQQRRAIQIAQSFKGCYLARMVYLNDCQMTIVTLKYTRRRQHIANEICVDTAGNVTVSCCQSKPGVSMGRALVWTSMVVLLTLGLFALFIL